jgi:hypothetical protein
MTVHRMALFALVGDKFLVKIGIIERCLCFGLSSLRDHAGGEAGLQRQLGDSKGRQRGLLGGLQDHGVAAGQGRAPLPGQHQQREVPGDDLADHADRLP